MKLTTIRMNNDFRRAYSKGKNIVSPLVVTYVRRNNLKETRIGITTSKKIGNAVERSRARRVLRAAYVSLAEGVEPGYDLVLVARGRTPHVKSTAIAQQLRRQLTGAGVLREKVGDGE